MSSILQQLEIELTDLRQREEEAWEGARQREEARKQLHASERRPLPRHIAEMTQVMAASGIRLLDPSRDFQLPFH